MVADNTKNTDLGKSLKADILLVTVTPIEARAVIEIFEQETGHPFKRHYGATNTYLELGVVQSANVFMVQSEMGIGGPTGALLTIEEAIRTLSPSSVVMVGIAFGFNKKKSNLGDILVSQQLWGYELQKVATDNGQEDIVLRGDRPHASPRLLSRFSSCIIDWQEPPHVEFGLILSGEKLIDNQVFRDKLLSLAPEALGGEMEGSGLYAAAYLRKTDWILVKAICDWADGTKGQEKDTRQEQAARNAARFTMHVLRQGGFAEDAEKSSPSQTPDQQSRQTRSLGTWLYTYDTHASWVVAVAWAPNGEHLASGAGDGTVRVWEAATGKHIITYRGHAGPLSKINIQRTIYTLAWAPEGLRIASGGDGANVFVWNAASGQTLAVYTGHSHIWPSIFALAWSPDGTRIASACSNASFDKTIHIWDVATESLVKKCDAHYGMLPSFSILSLAWSPDGTRIAATVFGEKAIRIWSAATGRQIASFPSPMGSASDIAWSHDGTRLALAHSDETAQVWDVQTGANIVHYRGHTDGVRSIAWSPDDTRLVTASNDKTVQLWDAATGKHIYTYRGHTDWATSASWSPDGTRIASASNDRTIQIWQAI